MNEALIITGLMFVSFLFGFFVGWEFHVPSMKEAARMMAKRSNEMRPGQPGYGVRMAVKAFKEGKFKNV